MSVNTTENVKSYACDGSLTDFDFPYKITGTDTSVLIVTIWEDATSTPTILSEESGAYSYSVAAPNNNYDNGGTISTTKLDGASYVAYAWPENYTITIERIVPYTQPSEFTAGGLDPKALEQTFDNQEFQIQQLDKRKSIHGPASDATSSIYELPGVTARKSKVLGFDADGDVIAIANVPTSGVSATAFAETLLDDATAAAARTTLVITLENLINAFNVKDYGAVGDGITDDLAAIQVAVDACIASATGGIVYFPPGKYSIGDGSITVTNGGSKSIWFAGAGMYASRIVKTTTGTDDTIIWNCTTNPSGIQNLGIIAAVGGNFSVDGISCTTMNGVFFENVWMGGFDNGFNLSGSDIHLTNCISELNNSYGFVFDKNIKAVNCKSYLNGYGFLLKFSSAPAFPDWPCVLVNCSDSESKNHALSIDSRDNVELIGFCTESAGWNGNVGIYIIGSNQIKIIGGNLRYLVDYGIQLVGACSNVIIDGVTIQEIGQTTTGKGIQMVGGSTNTLVTNCLLKNIRLSAIKTGNSSGTRIVNNTIHTFGRQETAGDKFGVLVDGDAATKGTVISSNRFVLSGGDTQTGIVFESGAQGKFFIRENEYQNGTLMDLANAPVGTIVERNQDVNYKTAVPTSGHYVRHQKIENTEPSAGNPPGWVCVSRVNTAMRVGASETETTLEVDDTTGITNGDICGVTLDDGTIQWSTCTVTDGDTLEFGAALTDDVAIDNVVYTLLFKAMANLV